MFVHLCILSLTLCHLSLSTAHPSEVRSDKPLFVPTYNLPNLMHLNPLRYGSLESASLYPQYAYGQGYDYWDSLQRQFPYQDTEKRLEGFLYAGGRNNKKNPIPVTEHNEDDYKHNLNKLSAEDVRPDMDHLDLRFKRSLTYTSWTPPTLSSTNNLDDRVQPSASRSVPFGPYTTWLPLEAPLVGYGGTTQQQSSNGVKSSKGSALKKTTNRRRREVIYADKDDHLTLHAQPLFIHQEYIPVPIAYSTPIIRNVPNTEGTPATAAGVFPSVAAVAPFNSFYTGKLSATLDTITGPNPDLNAVSYNVVRKK